MNKGDIRHKAPLGLRTVAIYELVKGLTALAGGLGLLLLVGKDIQASAEEILLQLHVDPAWHYSQKLIEASGRLTDNGLRMLALAAVVYAVIRFVETYGLWYERHWAEWFAVISAGLYLPVEIYHLWHHPRFLTAVIFLVNVIIVVYLARLLNADYRHKRHGEALPDSPSEKPDK